MSTLLALDPGKTTGASTWTYGIEQPLTLEWYGQIEDGIDGVINFLYGKSFDVIVSESFVIDGRTPNPDITPLRIEGVLEYHCYLNEKQLRFQRNNFKKHVSDELLKHHALYVPGMPHANDSMRHALAYMKTSRHAATLNQYFRDIEG